MNRPNGTISVIFQPPDEKEPDNSVGGASRDGGGVCSSDENLARSSETPIQEFLPLTPQNNYGLTIAERPTFYAYIPQTQAQKVFVTIRDRSQTTLYETELAIERTGGIVSWSLPNTVPPLEIGQDYEWSMVLICDRIMKPDSPRITSWIKRVEPLDIPFHSIDNQSNLELAAFYAQNGIWYDALNLLANLRHDSGDNPTNYQEQWQQFLSQEFVGLEAMIDRPLLEKPLLADN